MPCYHTGEMQTGCIAREVMPEFVGHALRLDLLRVAQVEGWTRANVAGTHYIDVPCADPNEGSNYASLYNFGPCSVAPQLIHALPCTLALCSLAHLVPQ